jgi:hypothetical protein
MGEREVRSPNSLTKDQYHPLRGISPGSRSSPSKAEAGHRAGHVGKSGSGPASLRRDNCDGPGAGSGWVALPNRPTALMTSDYRRHHASRDVQVIFVEVPVAGAPEPARRPKPPSYPRDSHQPWRPRTTPPPRRSQAGLRQLIDVPSVRFAPLRLAQQKSG